MSVILAALLEGSYRLYARAENARRAMERTDIGLFELANRCENLASEVLYVLDARRDEHTPEVEREFKKRGYPAGVYDRRTAEMLREAFAGTLFWLCQDLVKQEYVTEAETRSCARTESVDDFANIVDLLNDVAERLRVRLRGSQ
jgi:hypothetical protein